MGEEIGEKVEVIKDEKDEEWGEYRLGEERGREMVFIKI